MTFLKRVTTGLSAGVVAFSSVLTLMAPGVAHAVVQTCTWTGAAGDSKFNTSTNWSDCGASVPQTGDVIKLPYTVNSEVSIVNDLPAGTLLGGIILDIGGANSGELTIYTLDKLSFGDGAVLTSVENSKINISDTVTTTGSLVIEGAYEGWWSMFLPTSKDIVLTPTNFTLNNTPMECAGAARDFDFTIEPTGNVNVGTSSWYVIKGSETAVAVSESAGVSLPSGTYAGDITFNGGGAKQGSLCGTPVSLAGAYNGETTLTGTVKLMSGDINYLLSGNSKLTITGTLEGAGSALKADSSSTGTFVNNAKTNTTTTANGTQTVSMQEVPAVTDNKPDDSLTVAPNQILTFDGVRNSVYVSDNSILKGTGTVKTLLAVLIGGTVAPGHSPGCLSSDRLGLAGTYEFEIGGTAACDSYDQLKVLNASNVGDAVTIGNFDGSTEATLNTSLYNEYVPTQGEEYVIIEQAGSKAVKGTFKDLPEGATFEQNGVVFKISYVGGDGNDVTLTVQNTPTAPDTGFALIANNHFAVLAGLAVVTGGLLFVARKLQSLKK